MKLAERTETVLATKKGEFWLAWSISLLLGMFWVVPVSFSTPGFFVSLKNGITLLGGAILIVAIIAAVVILLLARTFEQVFARRGYRTLSAALGYLVFLFGVGFAIAALGYAFAYSSGIWFVVAGMALCVSSPVAFVGRLIYPSLKSNTAAASVVLVASTTLATFSLLQLILQPLLH